MGSVSGIVFDIKRGGTKDGPGIRTSVFLKGCPLRCAWCHNPESQSPEIQKAVTSDEVCGREMSVGEVMEEVRRDKVFYASSGGGVTFTGGEPTMQFDFLMELCKAAKAEGIHVAVDTCGFAPRERFESLLPVVDLFLYDLKCMDARRHEKLTGVSNELILENLKALDAAGAKTWIRCPVIPGLNDAEGDLLTIREFIAELRHVEKVDILPYHPIGLEKYAKFGMEVLYPQKEEPSPTDVQKWRRMIFG